jgi:hypothetical protein
VRSGRRSRAWPGGRAGGLLASSILLAAAAAIAAADPLVQEEAGAVVNWRLGVLSATAGAAPDHRMPSADVARAGAERRARASARTRIGEALRKLPLGGGRHLDDQAVSRALEQARIAEVDYQSDGGAVVTLEVAFGSWDAPTPPPPDSPSVALAVPEARLSAAPIVLIGTREIVPAAVRYSTAVPPTGAGRPLKARADNKGRLVVEASGAPALAGQPLLIYVHKVLR